MQPQQFAYGILTVLFVISISLFIMYGGGVINEDSDQKGLYNYYDNRTPSSTEEELRAVAIAGSENTFDTAMETKDVLDTPGYTPDSSDTNFLGAFTGFRNAWSYMTHLDNLMYDISNALGLPTFIVWFGVVALGVYMSLMALYFVRGFQPR